MEPVIEHAVEFARDEWDDVDDRHRHRHGSTREPSVHRRRRGHELHWRRHLGKRFVEVAAEAGENAVKFQTHIQWAELSESGIRASGHGDLYEWLRQQELTEDHRSRYQVPEGNLFRRKRGAGKPRDSQ